MEVVQDITEDGPMRETIANHIHTLNTILDCLGMIATARDDHPAQILNKILEAVGYFYHADRACIMLYDEKQVGLETQYEWRGENIPSKLGQSLSKTDLYGQDGQERFSTVLPTIVDHRDKIKDTNPQGYALLVEHGAQGVYIVPLINDGKSMGCIVVTNPQLSVVNYSFLRTMALFICHQVLYYELQTKQRYELYHDLLTGLKNHNGFMKWEEGCDKKDRSNLGCAVANINYLSKINHKYGFVYGDSIMASVGRTLTALCPTMHLFRFYGDEFIIITENDTFEHFYDTLTRARKKLKKVTPEGVTFGFAWDEENTRDVGSLIQRAQKQMLTNKQRIHEKDEEVSRYGDLNILKEVRKKIEAGRFKIYLQPKIDIVTNELVGMEALSRYQKDDGSIESPGQYIPFLEKANLIRHIDFSVLEQVCEVMVKWQAQGIALVPVSINFSRITITEESISDKIADVVDRYGLPHRYIVVEITESAGDMGQEMFTVIGHRLMAKGFGISLDDFCSKYSCMSLLTALPFYEVKIDRSMVTQIVTDTKARHLCEAIIGVCNQFNYQVVAEGIETAEQIEILRKIHCDVVQGYYFSRPLPLSVFEANYLRKWVK